MEKQQVQLNRMVFVDEIPEEVERIFRKSASSFSHSMGDPLIELTNLLEQKNYTVFLEKLSDFRTQLGVADMLLEDCNGIVKSYIAITTQDETGQATQNKNPTNHSKPLGSDIDIDALMQNMQEQAKKAQALQDSLIRGQDVQEG